MKTIITTLLFAAAVIFTSCEGPMGPPGFDGIDGVDGVNILGQVIEIQGDFTPGNDYKLYYEFPGNFEIYDGDVVLVYILWEVAGELDVWRLLPQTVVLDEGILQYNFDYTLADVQVWIEGTVPFNTLLPAETDNQIFRIAVLPAELAQDKSLDVTDLNAIMNKMKVNPNSINRMEVNSNLIK